MRAADYGNYYENPAQKKVVLTWDTPNTTDPSQANEITYRIYKNGSFLTEVKDTRYTDKEYKQNAQYEVSAVRTYLAPDAVHSYVRWCQ